MDTNDFSRREFLSTAAKGALLAGVVAPLCGSGLMAKGKSLPIQSITLDLTRPEYQLLTRVGGALKIAYPGDKSTAIIVSRVSETAVVAFSSKCPHLGCEVSLPENNLIKCACHASTFDGNGHVTHGPAKDDLRRFSASLTGAVLTIAEPTA